MRKSRFTETQIVAILKDQDAGVPTAELARRGRIHTWLPLACLHRDPNP
jgi:hypothetical protein